MKDGQKECCEHTGSNKKQYPLTVKFVLNKLQDISGDRLSDNMWTTISELLNNTNLFGQIYIVDSTSEYMTRQDGGFEFTQEEHMLIVTELAAHIRDIIIINDMADIYIAYARNSTAPEPKINNVDIIIDKKILKMVSIFSCKSNNLSVKQKNSARISGVAPQPNNP